MHAQPLSGDTTTIFIKAKPGMQYDPARFAVKPGHFIRLIFSNEDEMEHNLIIGKKDSRQKIVDAATALGTDGPIANYAPKISEVLWSIPILKSAESDTLIFRSPRSTGVYPYVCTFPGHGTVMYGGMHVTNGIMPDIVADHSVPFHLRKRESDKSVTAPAASGHPFDLIPPYLYRVLMPYAGPAAIAVCLPNKLNYCWDAGVCKLRYIWSGEFIDLTDYWTIKGELTAKILGSIFYKDSSLSPTIVIEGTPSPLVRFKGYRLIQGYPEFHYFVDDLEVFELIQSMENGSGIIRKFSLHNSTKNIRFGLPPFDNIKYSSDQGLLNKNELILSSPQSKSFSITMTKVNQ